METNQDENKHIVLLIFLAITLFIASALAPQISSYAFIMGVLIALFVVYLKFFGLMPSFVYKDYDVMLGAKIFNESFTTFNNEIKEIWLNGEDKFKYKKIGNCCGYSVYNIDTFPENFNDVKDKNGNSYKIEFLDKTKMKTKKVFIFFYLVYSMNGFIKILQKIVPRIPIISSICKNLPFISDITNPSYKGVIAPEDIVYFKNDIVELKGISLLPLSLKETFNTFSIVEFTGKFDELRNLERFLFDKELVKYNYTEMLNTAINSVNAGAKLNPKVKVTQEENIFKAK